MNLLCAQNDQLGVPSGVRPEVLTIHAQPGLMFDLTLLNNLLIAWHLGVTQITPAAREELAEFFGRCGSPLDWDAWSVLLPDQVTSLEKAKVWLGRAVLLKPDLLYINPLDWPEDELPIQAVVQAYGQQFPWRQLRVRHEN